MLGPLEVVDEDGVVRLGGGKERSLLALLLLHAGEIVSTDRIVDELWPDEPPAQAAKTVQVYVSRLRRRLGEDRIVTRSPGYGLVLGSSSLDIARLEQLIAAARDEPPRAATALLREALSLFRGPVLADVAHEAFAQPAIQRWEGLRLVALEARVEADLALGRAAELVPELEALVASHPFRERLRAQLSLALYRTGRQADALAAIREGRRALVDELGLEPAEELKALERSILAHDPALDAPLPEPVERGDDASTGGKRKRRNRTVVVGALVVAALALAASLSFVLGGDERAPIVAVPNSIVLLDGSTGTVSAAIPVLERPTAIAVFGDSVWALHPDARTVTQVSRGERKVSRTIGLGGAPASIVADERGLWISDALAGSVTLIDPDRPESRRTFGVRRAPLPLTHSDAGALGLGFGTVWLASGQRTVTRIDPNKLVVRGVVRDVGTAGPGIGGIAVGPDAVWVGNLRAVQRIDPRSNTVVAVVEPAVFRVSGIAASPEGAWFTDIGSDQVFLVDAARTQVAGATKVGGQPLGIAYGRGAVWVANSGDGTVSRIDATTGRVTTTITVGGSPTGITVSENEVWVTIS